MDYEKLYKDAFKRAKEQLEGAKVFDYKEEQIAYDIRTTTYAIFPELAESEDERIRKDLIGTIHLAYDCGVSLNKEQHDKAIAWLEKQGEQKLPIEKLPSEMKTIGESLGFTTQEDCNKYNQMVTDLIMSDDDNGEQKPADKVEPKFKVGDWITNGIDFTFKVMSIKDGMYYRDDDYFIDIETVDKTFRLWTIDDAKDGDVLVIESGRRNNECLFIFKDIADREVLEYCYYRIIDNTFSPTGSFIGYLDNVYHPATKEQRNLLFNKMKEAGYEWDAEKKELKKIEHNPWSEEDEGMRLDTIKAFQLAYPYATEEENPRKRNIDWLKSLKPQSRWKPTDEQIHCFKCVIDFYKTKVNDTIVLNLLNSLYNNLLKL